MGLDNTFRDALAGLHGGKLGFAEFVRATLHVWRGLAAYLLRRWSAGPAVAVDDVVQELLSAVPGLLPRWDPERSDLARFVVYNAMSSAKTWIHAQRGANKHGSRDRNPSRRECTVSELLSPGSEDDAANRFAVAVDGGQEARCERRAAAERFALLTASPREAFYVTAIVAARGDAEEAGRVLYADAEVRRMCRFGSERDAVRKVERARRFAEALAARRVAP